MMDKKPDGVSDDVWEAVTIPNPKIKRVTDAMRGYDIGEVSAAELKVIMEENRVLAPHTAQKLIDMLEKEINKENK